MQRPRLADPVRLAVAAVLALAVSAPALADDCLDQQVAGGTDTPAPLISGWQWAQTFTCEAGGELSRLEVEYDAGGTPPGTVSLQLRSTVDGHPDSGEAALLATVDLPIVAGPGVQTLALDLGAAGVIVYPGDVLAAVLVTETPGYDVFTCARWRGYQSDAYAGGQAFYKASVLDWVAQETVDLTVSCYLDCATPVAGRSWSAVKGLF
ncbi:MAG: hypothetical protein R3D98_06995 [Candidatus Krumholzibacteriia bacterium]